LKLKQALARKKRRKITKKHALKSEVSENKSVKAKKVTDLDELSDDLKYPQKDEDNSNEAINDNKIEFKEVDNFSSKSSKSESSNSSPISTKLDDDQSVKYNELMGTQDQSVSMDWENRSVEDKFKAVDSGSLDQSWSSSTKAQDTSHAEACDRPFKFAEISKSSEASPSEGSVSESLKEVNLEEILKVDISSDGFKATDEAKISDRYSPTDEMEDEEEDIISSRLDDSSQHISFGVNSASEEARMLDIPLPPPVNAPLDAPPATSFHNILQKPQTLSPSSDNMSNEPTKPVTTLQGKSPVARLTFGKQMPKIKPLNVFSMEDSDSENKEDPEKKLMSDTTPIISDITNKEETLESELPNEEQSAINKETISGVSENSLGLYTGLIDESSEVKLGESNKKSRWGISQVSEDSANKVSEEQFLHKNDISSTILDTFNNVKSDFNSQISVQNTDDADNKFQENLSDNRIIDKEGVERKLQKDYSEDRSKRRRSPRDRRRHSPRRRRSRERRSRSSDKRSRSNDRHSSSRRRRLSPKGKLSPRRRDSPKLKDGKRKESPRIGLHSNDFYAKPLSPKRFIDSPEFKPEEERYNRENVEIPLLLPRNNETHRVSPYKEKRYKSPNHHSPSKHSPNQKYPSPDHRIPNIRDSPINYRNRESPIRKHSPHGSDNESVHSGKDLYRSRRSSCERYRENSRGRASPPYDWDELSSKRRKESPPLRRSPIRRKSSPEYRRESPGSRKFRDSSPRHRSPIRHRDFRMESPPGNRISPDSLKDVWYSESPERRQEPLWNSSRHSLERDEPHPQNRRDSPTGGYSYCGTSPSHSPDSWRWKKRRRGSPSDRQGSEDKNENSNSLKASSFVEWKHYDSPQRNNVSSPAGELQANMPDSTISDSELVKEPPSPKRLSLDERLQLELGEDLKPAPEVSEVQYHQNYYYPIPVHDSSHYYQPPYQRAITSTNLIQPPRIEWDPSSQPPSAVPPQQRNKVLQVFSVIIFFFFNSIFIMDKTFITYHLYGISGWQCSSSSSYGASCIKQDSSSTTAYSRGTQPPKNS
jgi:hypothetical protein